MHKILALLNASAILLIAGCASVPRATGDVDARQAQLNDGYALLYDFVNQNQGVGTLLIIKSTPESTATLVREIAKASAEATTKLKAFAKQDPTLGYDQTGLPEVETASRKAISSATASALLTSSGEAFERQLLLSQIEGTNYGASLARVLIEYDDNPDRREWLKETADRFASLHQRAVERLAPVNETPNTE